VEPQILNNFYPSVTCFNVSAPSYIEPLQEAATGVGGIVKDVLSMGSRPIAVKGLSSLTAGSWPLS
jgi:hypothetical protein